MGNSLRCCLACVLPCGALDVIRIVHINGHVEEYSRPVAAGEILAANPNHVLSKPSCSQGDSVMRSRRILIVSPDSDLKRGNIYFLIPASSLPTDEKKKKKNSNNNKAKISEKYSKNSSTDDPMVISSVADDRNYLKEILSEKKAGHRRRKNGARVAIWRPHLQSIAEDT